MLKKAFYLYYDGFRSMDGFYPDFTDTLKKKYMTKSVTALDREKPTWFSIENGY